MQKKIFWISSVEREVDIRIENIAYIIGGGSVSTDFWSEHLLPHYPPPLLRPDSEHFQRIYIVILFCIALHRIEGMIGCVEMRAPAHYWPFRTVGGKLHCLAVSLLIIMMTMMMMKQNITKILPNMWTPDNPSQLSLVVMMIERLTWSIIMSQLAFLVND